MADTVHVEVARTVERDALLEALRAHGLDAHALDDGLSIEIPCDEDKDRRCDEVVADVEDFIASSGLPLVPLRSDGAVLIRPPAS